MRNQLNHYGVLGMKWGVRRSQNKNGTRISAGEKRRSGWSDDAKDASRIEKKKMKEMSNAELRKLNERTRLEREYRNLNPHAIAKGMKFVGATVATMGTIMALHSNGKQVINLGKNVGNKIVDMVGDRMMNELAKNL